jgi:glycine cleavage system H lipoate-binding protein/NAD-dependent dihydropyrimidine dehydrogenase PreA subunit
MERAVQLTIDGRSVSVPRGATVLEAADRLGIEIPRLCTQEGMSPYGACRLCTVEIAAGGRTRFQAACSYPAADGLAVTTDSPRVLQGRRIVLELLLARCPDNKAVREYARRWGVGRTRFPTREQSDCILCGKCVRACADVVGAQAIGFSGRGASRKVDFSYEAYPERCIACGLCTYVCPTGAAQMEGRTAARLRKAVGTERTCRYMLMGVVSAKTCPENIDCRRCPYDQLLEFVGGTHAALRSPPIAAAGPVQVGPFELRPDRSYARNHVWVRDLRGLLLVGADHFLSATLGPVDAVHAGDGKLRLTSGRRELALALPAGAAVVRTNREAETLPRLVNFSPYDRGWLAVLRPGTTGGTPLLAGLDARRWMQSELRRLEKLVGQDAAALRLPVAARHWMRVSKACFSAAEPAASARPVGEPRSAERPELGEGRRGASAPLDPSTSTSRQEAGR